MADAKLDLGLGDHRLVDMVNFGLLQMRTTCLESHIASINQNLTDFTNLVKNIVVNLAYMARGTSGASQPSPVEPQVQVTASGGGNVAQHSSAGTSGVNPPITSPVTTLEISNSFKNLKPSTFRGEEKDWNKDSMHTFIQKWTDLHVLRQTPDEQRALGISLSLEGKAYKWWLSLDETACPHTWNTFQELFRK